MSTKVNLGKNIKRLNKKIKSASSTQQCNNKAVREDGLILCMILQEQITYCINCNYMIACPYIFM